MGMTVPITIVAVLLRPPPPLSLLTAPLLTAPLLVARFVVELAPIGPLVGLVSDDTDVVVLVDPVTGTVILRSPYFQRIWIGYATL